MAHWKHTATRCAMPLCEQTRRRGWTTCAYYGHVERGVSLYGLKPGEPRLTEVLDFSGARVPDIGETVMHYVDYDVGTVQDRFEREPGHWEVYVRWSEDGPRPWAKHGPDELTECTNPPAATVDTEAASL